MKKRTNVLFAHVVNKGLIMSRFRGQDEAKRMMTKAGLPANVISRVLLQEKNIKKDVRRSDWH
ncbi:MAG: phage tail protein [Pseudomonadota bacterium]